MCVCAFAGTPRFVGAMDPAISADNEATVKLNLKTMSIMMNAQSMTLESASLCKCVFVYVCMYVCTMSMMWMYYLVWLRTVDVTEGEMVMLYGSLSPANLGSITCYLPVLLSDIL